MRIVIYTDFGQRKDKVILFTYCPSCSSKNIVFKDGKVFRCPDCGFTFYHNIAAATGCLIIVPEEGKAESLVFLVRGKEPAVGKLDLPGGFVDVGEGVFEGLHRELQEEIDWTPPIPPGKTLKDVYTLFASFSNVYEYKNINYNTCDMYFTVCAPGLKPEHLRLEKAEVSDVRFLKPDEINFSDFAFCSTRKAVETYLKQRKM